MFLLSEHRNPAQVKARILYVDPSSRLVGLSLRSHLLPPEGSLLDNVMSERIGEVLKGCKMLAVHYYSGAVMELPDGTTTFVHVSNTKHRRHAATIRRVPIIVVSMQNVVFRDTSKYYHSLLLTWRLIYAYLKAQTYLGFKGERSSQRHTFKISVMCPMSMRCFMCQANTDGLRSRGVYPVHPNSPWLKPELVQK